MQPHPPIVVATNVFAYGRASTEKQTMSIPEQERRCRDWFTHMQEDADVTWCGWFPDAAITSNIDFPKRPAANEMLSRCRPGDLIIVATFDRMFRSSYDKAVSLKLLSDMDVSVQFLNLPYVDTSTPEGRLQLTVMAGFGEYERDCVAVRTKRIMSFRRAHGLPIGVAPPGWKTKKTPHGSVFEEDHKARKIGAYIATLRDECGLAYDSIVRVLAKQKIAPPGKWKRRDAKHTRPGYVQSWSRSAVTSLYKSHKQGYPPPDGVTPMTAQQLAQMKRSP